MYNLSFTTGVPHYRQRAPVEAVLSASGTSHLGMIYIQATTKSKYYDQRKHNCDIELFSLFFQIFS
jgi:hypothetical protein